MNKPDPASFEKWSSLLGDIVYDPLTQRESKALDPKKPRIVKNNEIILITQDGCEHPVLSAPSEPRGRIFIEVSSLENIPNTDEAVASVRILLNRLADKARKQREEGDVMAQLGYLETLCRKSGFELTKSSCKKYEENIRVILRRNPDYSKKSSTLSGREDFWFFALHCGIPFKGLSSYKDALMKINSEAWKSVFSTGCCDKCLRGVVHIGLKHLVDIELLFLGLDKKERGKLSRQIRERFRRVYPATFIYFTECIINPKEPPCLQDKNKF